MAFIKLTTNINAPVEKCFDLSRSIDLHLQSMQHSNERAIAGKTAGLISLNETVTWRARHFGIRMKMTVKVTAMEYPLCFTDQMVKGPFKLLRHIHSFSADGKGTVMTDVFEFQSPFGILGKLADRLFLKRYMQRLLQKRNIYLKHAAEALPRFSK
ncbi:MAG: cell division protein [Hymenobacter sp.]|nr:MAG: cell division protein [Hymenobacter sp.]